MATLPLTNSDYNLLVSNISSQSIYELEFVFQNLLFFKILQSFGDGPCFLLDPFKGEVLKIPTTETNSMKDKHPKDWYGMGFDNTTNTYKIVYVYRDSKNNQLVANVHVLGQKSCSWLEIQAVPPCGLSHINVCLYRDTHWLVREGGYPDIGGRRSHILSFDFKKEKFYWTPHPVRLYWRCTSCFFSDYHLLILKGAMTLVDASGKYVHIWVMKNYSKKEWSLEYKTDIQMFVELPHDRFTNYTCGEWKNGIFFTKKEGSSHNHPTVCYFWDRQRTSIKRVDYNVWSGFDKRVFSYTGSLISLKGLDELIQSTDADRDVVIC